MEAGHFALAVIKEFVAKTAINTLTMILLIQLIPQK